MFDQLARSINLRDLGGVRTARGGTVRTGRVFRSAALSALAGDALEAVRALGIHMIVDLRHNDERADHPTPWQALGCQDYWCRDHHDSGADLGARLRDPALTAQGSRAAMLDLYRALPYAQAESYARLFRAIADGRGPVLFHCAVGKDRTGVAAALILAAVGVPHDLIVADYVATGRYDLQASPHASGHPLMSAVRAAIFAPLLTVDAAYLDAMFAAVAARSGSIERYLVETLALSAQDCDRVRTALLDD